MIVTHQVIEGDLFNITNRLKQIDSAYFLARNLKTKKFELHAKGQRGSSLCLVLPFDRLDNRTIVHARRTRAERAHILLKKMIKEDKRKDNA